MPVEPSADRVAVVVGQSPPEGFAVAGFVRWSVDAEVESVRAL